MKIEEQENYHVDLMNSIKMIAAYIITFTENAGVRCGDTVPVQHVCEDRDPLCFYQERMWLLRSLRRLAIRPDGL